MSTKHLISNDTPNKSFEKLLFDLFQRVLNDSKSFSMSESLLWKKTLLETITKEDLIFILKIKPELRDNLIPILEEIKNQLEKENKIKTIELEFQKCITDLAKRYGYKEDEIMTIVKNKCESYVN